MASTEDTSNFSQFFARNISPLVIKTILIYLFYGIFFVLFCICMFFHNRHGSSMRKPFQRAALIGMFFLATSTTVLDTVATLKQLWLSFGSNWRGNNSLDNNTINRMNVEMDIICGSIIFLLYVLTNFLADLILIHRNFVIWSGQRLMIWVPLCVSILNNALAIIGVSFDARNTSRFPTLSVPINQYTNGDKLILTYLVLNACLNFGLTGCLAGRIWWLGRSSRTTQKLRRKYDSAVAITLESGVLYPVALIISVAVTVHRPTSPSMYPFLVQIVGIAPTLIIVRTVLGLSVEQSHEHDNNHSTVLDTYPSTIDGEKAGLYTTTMTSRRSSFGNRFVVSSQTAPMRSPLEIPVSKQFPTQAQAESDQSSHSAQISASPNSGGKRVPRRPSRAVPRGARSPTRRSIDNGIDVTRSPTPPLNILVHTSVEQVSEYHPRFQSFSRNR
ncbi:hypothetical protein D9757_003071 [Collybiopsis confluens]|uniref:Uncharacterized protein n=1 Tax=Collybiopsis confluens TaxID=2823264 RepID=A0A8H5HX73_9AGAR|nr:hypothetical protein D9757_003071 [Collybiopsis confluens]